MLRLILLYLFMKRIKKSSPNVLGVEALQGDDDCIGLKVNTADGYADYLFSVTDMQAHHPPDMCHSVAV